MNRLLLLTVLFLTKISIVFATDNTKLFSPEALANAKYKKYERFANEIRSYLDSNSFLGIELLLAGDSNRRMESRWGHLLLRFVDHDADPYNDMVLSFEAIIDDLQADYLKGAVGGYVMAPAFRPLSYYLRFYLITEGRPIHRYIIPTSDTDKEHLKYAIRYALDNPGYIGDYEFFENNCSTAMHRILSAILPLERLISIPEKAPEVLTNRLIFPMPAITQTSAQTALDKLAKRTGNKLVVTGSLEDSSSMRTGILGLSARELHMIYTSTSITMSDKLREFILDEFFKKKSENIDYFEWRPVPREMYTYCDNEQCRKKYLDFLSLNFSSEQLNPFLDSVRKSKQYFAVNSKVKSHIRQPLIISNLYLLQPLL